MLDWQINEQEQPLPDLSQEERPVRRVRRWRLWGPHGAPWGGLLLVLMVVGLFAFRWRLSERTEAMEADLKAFIRHEEQQRAFGLIEEADGLMVPNAPEGWQGGYRSTFVEKSDEVRPASLKIEETSLNGTEAYVTVRLDSVAQMRFYRLVGGQWRRAPLFPAFWGEQKQIELADEGITIVYRTLEEPFAQRLAADLPTLLQQWPNGVQLVMPFTIKIEPMEFGSAQLYISHDYRATQITLNSPQLIMPEYANVDGEGAIRLTLADALLEEVDLNYDAQQPLLPGGVTFLGALRNTVILRWALPDGAIPRQLWRDKVEGRWKSPFLRQWLINRDDVLLSSTWQPRLSEATALLMADYLYDQIGPEELQHVIKQLPTAPSWDRVFYPYTRRYTISLEEEMLLGNPAKMTAHDINSLPLSVTVLDMDPERGLLEAEITGQGRKFSIKTDDSILKTPEWAIFSGRCAMLHQEVTITEGDWLEVGQTLQARQLLVSSSEPAMGLLPTDTTLARPDTLAYLAERRRSTEQGGRFSQFLALSEDGTTTDLMTLPSLMTAVWSMQSQNPWPSRFLLGLSVPNCEQTWLLMYDPQQGMVGRWLFDSGSPFGFISRPEEGDFILLNAAQKQDDSAEKNQYWSAIPGQPLHLLGEVEPWPMILGSFAEQAVTMDEGWAAIKLIDLQSGETTETIPLVEGNNRIFGLSADGRRLFYMGGLPTDKKQAFYVLELESGQNRFLFSASQEQLLQPGVGPLFTNHLFLLSSPVTDEELIATRLLLVDLNTSSEPKVIMDIPPNEYVTSALACADDRLLMTISKRGQTEAYVATRWQHKELVEQ